MQRPALEEILEASVPCSIDVPGVLAPHPRHHAIILAVHAWRHRPLLCLRDLVDVAAVSSLVAHSDLDRQARDWGVERVWKTTSGAIDALFFGGQTTIPLRTWARHLVSVREQTVLERHVAHFGCGYWEVGPAEATSRLGTVLKEELSPAEGETWRQKLRRILGALRDAACRDLVATIPPQTDRKRGSPLSPERQIRPRIYFRAVTFVPHISS